MADPRGAAYPRTIDSGVSSALSRLVRVSIERPAVTIALALALAALAGLYTARTLTFQSSSVEFLPQHHVYVQRFKDNLREFGELNDIVVVVEASPVATARVYADRLAAEIRAVPGVKRVAHRIDPDSFTGHALLFLSTERLNEIRDKVLEHRRFLQRYAATPTLAGLFDALAEEIARRFATGFVDLGLGDGPAEGLDAGFLDTLLEVVTDSLDASTPVPSPWGRVFAPGAEETGAGYFRSGDDRLFFILVEPSRDVRNFTDNEHLISTIRRLIGVLHVANPGVAAGVTGTPALSNDEMLTAFRDSTAATILAFALTLASLLIVIRRLAQPVVMLAVLAVSLAWTLGIVSATIGHLSVFSVMFISLLLGLGIDYGVYVLLRYERELVRGPTPRDALEIMARRTGPGILFGALTAAGTFGVLMLTEFKGIQEFGFIAGTSIFMAFLAMMTVFPATLVVMARHSRSARVQRVPARTTDERVAPLERILGLRTPIVLSAALLTAGALAALPALRFDYNRLNLQAQATESVTWERKIAETRRSGFAALTTADSLSELSVKQAAFERLPAVAEVVSVLKIIPSEQAAKIATIRQIAPLLVGLRVAPRTPFDVRATTDALQTLDRRLDMAVREAEGRTSVQSLRAARARAEALVARLRTGGAELAGRLVAIEARLHDDFVAKLTRLQDNLVATPITVASLPEELQRKFVGVTGRLLLQIYPAIDTWEREGAREFVTAVRTVDPAVTGSPVISYEATRLMEAAYLHGTIYAVVLVTAFAAIMLRRPLDALLSVTPVLLGTLWTVGFMRVFGLSFNLANVWGLPLIIGGAAEFGLNVTLRYRESIATGGPAFPRSTVMAVVLNGLTTLAGFGSLMVAHHRGIFGLGLLLTVGVACSLAASLVVLPLLLRLVDARQAARAAAAAVVALVLVVVTGTASAGEPTEQIRADITRLFETLHRQPASPDATREAERILDRMFDWTAMAQAALREHWKRRTPGEQAEFTRLFAAVFRRAYAARIHLVDASRFRYLGDSITGDDATVRTKVQTKRGSTIDVDYAVRRDGGPRWLVQDVRVEKISLVDNYRVQFDTLIARSSYESLVKRLREGCGSRPC